MRSLIKLGLLLVAGILVYNYFFGTQEEKETSKEIFEGVRNLGKATWDLLKTEKEKFDEGKYDEAFNKIGNLFDSLRDKAEKMQDSQVLDQLSELERRRQELEKRVAQNEGVENYDQTGPRLTPEQQQERQEEIRRDWKDLLEDTERLMNQMEREQ